MSNTTITSEIAEIDNSNVFLPEDSRILNKTMKIREDIIDKFIEEDEITKVGNARVINEILNSMDSQVLSKTDKRLKQKDNENTQDVTEIIKNILLETSLTPKPIPMEQRDLNVTIELNDDDVVYGEDKIEYEELDIDNFIKD